MTTDSLTCHGVVHGKVIELDGPLGLPEGQPVTVIVQPAAPAENSRVPGDGIRSSAGAWSEDAGQLDDFLAWNRQQRKTSRLQAEDAT